ncbi:GH3 auxin-responsive promoter family protein [Brasilonema sp. CT11]|nr:GH3 auxin-responsive promoter family protein [Brasilonema sp. CT11]
MKTAYRSCRSDSRIDQLELKLVQKDTFKLLQQMLFSTGTSSSQFKMPRLLKNPQQVEFMESMVIYNA